MLNLDRLRTLHAISAYGSVTAAADVLHLTTSAVSQQVAKLEREVGQPLLDKRGRGVVLTDFALRMVDHAAEILAVVERAEADLQARRGSVEGRLTIGAFATAARGLVPPAFVALRAEHPRLRLELVEMEPDESVPLVVRGDLDLVVALDWSNAPLAVPSGLVPTPLLHDPAMLAVPADHRLAANEFVDVATLRAEAWITWQRGSICRDWLAHTLRTHGGDLDVTHAAREHETQLALVAAGLGIAIIPTLGLGPVPDGVRMLPLRPAFGREVHILTRGNVQSRPAIRATVAALHTAAAQHARTTARAAPHTR
ncbi:LysR family transcriptional regulator [Pseudonocardia sp. TRM90224]|uniref:LysR family transcriptional regulator n=1 Tax=Pseudonocardia sp. TRM90224 TaxID=2812678 RepID=UPI001E307AEE|nr:LysR family transcriptional regulator [Pseudonocardia sp. TRM90224]